MRTNPRLWPCSAALALLAAVPAWGQFSYTSDFNSVTPGTKPPGWVTQNSVAPSIDPMILAQDPAGWETVSTATWWGMPGSQDYSASGGSRLTLVHPGLYGGSEGATAWYAGPAANYPMNLQSQSLKVEFDLFLRTGTQSIAFAGDGGVFAIQAVTDTADAQFAVHNCGSGAGMLGWQAGGFAIEFDNFPTAGDPDPGNCNVYHGNPVYNHVGVNLYPYWNVGTFGVLPCVQTDLDVLDLTNGPFYFPCGVAPDVLPDLKQVGNSNTPVHVTVYYNDPTEGGLGQVRAYMYMPDSSALPYPWFVIGGFGTAPRGNKILDYQVGPWPTTGAVFGFSAGNGGVNGIFQVANMKVTTTAVSGTAPAYPGAIPQLASGSAVTLTASPTSGTPDQPGWDVSMYTPKVQLPSGGFLRYDLGTDLATGINTHLSLLTNVTGEPNIDYVDTGANGNLARGRHFPGLTDGADHDNFGMVAKGWIQFPAAGNYCLGVGADDNVEVCIGGQVVLSGYTGMAPGPDADIHCTLQVNTAGFYPIQVSYVAAAAGDGVEFYRRLTDITNPMTFPYVAIGSSNAGLSDQPVVYGLLNGNPPPQADPWTVTLSKSERISGGSATGGTGFVIKTTPSPWIYYNGGPGYNIYWNRDRACEEWTTTPLMFLDFLGNDPAHASTSDTINFATGDTTGWRRAVTGGNPFPNTPADVQMFAMRADGFVDLAPGAYYLGLDANDEARLFIGNQAIDVVYYSPHIMVFKLVVPSDAGGTYPIRVEYCQYLDVGYVDLYQAVGGNLVPVGGPGSTISVHQEVTTGASYHKIKSNGYVIPASAKRAGTGTGGTVGWNATFATMVADLPYFGYGEASLAYDLAGRHDFLIAAPPDTSQHPTVVAYGANQGFGHFPSSQTDWKTTFTSCPADYDNFAVAVEGLIDFPAPGDYGLNTCTSGISKMWIGGVLVQSHSVDNEGPWAAGDNPQDNVPASIHVDEAGLYDIRVAYVQVTAVTPSPVLEIFQYQTADASAVLLNTPGALNVYQNLVGGGVPHNPVVLPVSAKVAPYDAGLNPGLHAEVVYWAGASGDTYGNSVYGGLGHDAIMNLHQAKDLLDGVVNGDADALLRQQGISLWSGTVSLVDFGTDYWVLPAGEAFPNPQGFGAWIAIRLTGRIALKQGGSAFCPFADDEIIVKIGGVDMHREGATYEAHEYPHMYVYAPEDGLYPIEIDYLAKAGNNFLWIATVDAAFTKLIAMNSEPDFYGTKLYADVASCDHQPFADADGDGDVDQDDFGEFQHCFTGPTPSAAPAGVCKCFDRDNYGAGNGAVDAADLIEFMRCWTGPAVLWSAVQPQGCNP